MITGKHLPPSESDDEGKEHSMHLNVYLIIAGVLLLLASLAVEKQHKHGSKLLSIPGICLFVAGFNWHDVQRFIQP